MSSIDDLLAGGGKSFKFENPGDTVTGVVKAVQVRQARDFDTGKPSFWDDGQPQEQIAISLATDMRDPADPQDDGERNIYIKGWGGQLQAFRAAVKTGGKPAPGDTFTASFTRFGAKPDRGFPPKEFIYQVVKASALDGLVGGQPVAAPQPVSAPAAQPTSAPAPAPVAPAAAPTGGDTPLVKAKALHALGMSPEQIAPQLGLDVTVVAALIAA